jgi:hypothetical protein
VFRKYLLAICAALALSLAGAHAGDAVAISQHDGLTWADVTVGGRVLHFVVDTGATSSCINLAAARRIGIPLGNPVTIAGVGGETTGYRCGNFQASAGGMRLPAEVLALDLSGPARACSQPIDGLIGADFFRGKVVRLDFARGLLMAVAQPVDGGMPLRFLNGVMCAPVALNGGSRQWTRLDTGCSDTVVWCGPTRPGGKDARKSVALAWPGAHRTKADVAVGGRDLGSLAVTLRPKQIFPGEAGLLGNAALSKYRVTIDAVHGRLALE